ncbi:hypothetical protein [Chitinimonas sp.]|uniref:hypothetical protein n=1 Tax=Chitinimonas sp. TaxID=1934313 RepID=UPI002F94BDE7
MTPEQDAAEIVRHGLATGQRQRGYADFFCWTRNRDVEEWGVAVTLAESLALDGRGFYTDVLSRGRGKDPPDCEARDLAGRRLAIEVTELVDGRVIQQLKYADRACQPSDWAEWDRATFLGQLDERIASKDRRYPELKAPPYPGGYVVVVYTDEPKLDRDTVASYLAGYRFRRPRHILRAFLLLSHDPAVARCPYFELGWR